MASGGAVGTPFNDLTESQLKALKIPELKECLRRFGLKTSGNKAELIVRILQYSASVEQKIDDLEAEITKLQEEFERSQRQLENSQHRIVKTSTPVSNNVPSISNKIKVNTPVNKSVISENKVNQNVVKDIAILDNNDAADMDNADEDSSTDEHEHKPRAVIPQPTLNASKNTFTVNTNKKSNTLVSHSQPYNNNDSKFHDSFVNKNELMEMIKVLSDNMTLSRLPTPEPPIFDGNPLQYQEWNQSFTLMIEQARGLSENDKLFFLKKYLKGPALEAVDGFLISSTTDSYKQAKALLDERYGDTYIIAEAYRKKLNEWPPIPKNNSQALRAFSDFLIKCRAAMNHLPDLQRLDDTQQNQQMLRLLPDYIITKWNNKVGEFKLEKKGFPKFADFVRFMAIEADLASHPTTSLEAIKKLGKTPGKAASVSHAASTSPDNCCVCGAQHKVFQCLKFQGMTLSQRQETVKKYNLCYLCLNGGHGSRNCSKKLKCKDCKKKHNTLLHHSTTTANEPAALQDSSNCGSVQNDHGNGKLLLSAMIVPVYVSSKSDPSIEYLTYAMLDTQSDSTFVTERLYSSIQCKSVPVSLKLSTMTSKDKLIKCQKLLDLTVRGYHSSSKIPISSCYTREFIPHNKDHLPTPEMARNYSHLEKIASKIPFNLDCEVELLIGYNCPKALAPTSVIQAIHDEGEIDQPYAVETILGWSIVGCLTCPVPASVDVVGVSHRIMGQETSSELHVQGLKSMLAHRTKVKEFKVDAYEVMRLLEGDFCTPTETSPMSQEDQRFIDILSSNIHQDSTGHYVMPLPFKQDKPLLPNNREQALARFRMLQKRLAKNSELDQLYTKFITDLVTAGEAELVPEEELKAKEVWYLPHHGVLNPNKPGKVRVVFDGSCDYRGHVLNKYLLQGPDLNNNLVGVLTRFRKEHVTIACDVSKMFYQFKVSPPDRDYLRFLWTHPDDEHRIVDYRMTVHIFGATSSPGCAKFGLLKLASDHGQSTPEAMEFIKRNFYVDDGLSSCSSTSEAIQLLSDARAICAQGNLKLHKLLSNKSAVLEAFPKSDWAIDLGGIPEFSLSVAPTERMLGLQWFIQTDEFTFFPKLPETFTSRRIILSILASIFDPLGFIAPVTLLGRQILQHCCNGMDWDDHLPETIVIKWRKWLSDASLLSSVKIPRCVKPEWFGEVFSAELHTFSDASEKGYGACCYLRLCDQDGHIHCSLLFGKARVPPLKKKITIPRLELQAALLAARIGNQMSAELDMPCKLYFYTDSLIVLGYITNSSKRFHTFVANRVSQIRELTDVSQWRHIKGLENPADHASRGLQPSELMSTNWLTGPSLLWKHDVQVPSPVTTVSDDDPEVKVSCLTKVKVEDSPLLIQLVNHWSKWSTILHFTSLIYKTAKLRWRSDLTAVEIRQQAEVWLLSMLQNWYFAEEYSLLCLVKKVPKSSPLWRLDPFIDDSGLIRVGGRIKHSVHSHQIKHPIILPGKHHITMTLVRHYHNLVAHQGRGFTMATIRSAGYWIVNGSATVSSIIYHCVLCRIMRRPTEVQKMADLPCDRTDPAPPFSYTGCDCFGPFQVKDGRKIVKKYGLIFTCMSSRAVHIELLDAMSTDGFINSLRCFIALRGNIRQLRCDRGTNFVGAARELQKSFEEILNSDVKQFLLTNKCEFLFNPPGASHMGGTWERLIRTVKNVLHGIMLQSQSRLDVSSARTVMYEAMAIVNSRPIATQNEADLEPLTPNHLILMKSERVLPPPGNFERIDLYTRKRWRQVQYLIELFWSRWKAQYLSTLQVRRKWQQPKRNVSVDDVVLLKEGSLRGEWRLGRVVEVFPGKDGLVRKVKLRVGSSSSDQKGLLERPVTKMVVLLEAVSQQ